jgi:hypothetical protein
MISNYSKTVTVDTTGGLVLEFPIAEMDSLVITPSKDSYVGFNDLSQCVFPVLGNASLAISHQDFKNKTIEKIYALIQKYLFQKPAAYDTFDHFTGTLRIYARGQSVNSDISIAYLGGNF